MWKLDIAEGLGFLSTLEDTLSRAQRRGSATFPDLRSYQSLVAASDYSGYHPKALYRGLSFVLAGGESVGCWFDSLRAVRRLTRLGERRLSFKTLKDRVRNKAFYRFVTSADSLDGVLVTFLIHNKVESLFGARRPRDSSLNAHPLLHGYSPQSAERVLEITHLLALLLSGLSGAGQSVLWVTDHDDIVPNQDRLNDLVKIFVRVSSNILPHHLQHLRVGTPSMEKTTLDVEDLLALPDVAAGSMCDLVERLFPVRLPSADLSFPRLSDASEKTAMALNWLSYGGSSLKKVTIAIDEDPESKNLRASHLQLHGSSSG